MKNTAVEREPGVLGENLDRIEAQISAACQAAGRPRSEVTLMAVSKMHPASAILAARALGVRVFGENRVQEFQEKSAQLAGAPGAEFHLIGHLQSNKTARAAELFASVDTLDSVALAERLNEAANRLGRRLAVLIEIKLSHEASKAGLEPESAELPLLLERLPDLTALEFRGLMTVPPFLEDAAAVRPYFSRLRVLRDEMAAAYPRLSFAELSMGMSHDFPVAIAEGATQVRIGTALFGARTYPK
ncbi:MAG: YggS family pyridoxal phosphate-dependent enzyme [Acidobacteriaceae bacterium]